MDAILAATHNDQPAVDYLAAEGTVIGSAGQAGIWLFRFANGCVRAVAQCFAYGFFWVAASAIYLLLRHEVDHTETDEIYLDDESENYGLPPLSEDEAGVPKVDDEPEPPSDEADDNEEDAQ